MSRGVRGAAEMLDSYLNAAPIEIDATPRPDETSIANYERALGAAVLRGEISAGQAYVALGTYMDWQAAGEPKMDEQDGQPR